MFRLDDWDIPNRAAFLLGRFIGELPIIAICGVVVLAFLRITSVPTINLRTLAIALAFGSVLDALVIYPIVLVIATSA